MKEGGKLLQERKRVTNVFEYMFGFYFKQDKVQQFSYSLINYDLYRQIP